MDFVNTLNKAIAHRSRIENTKKDITDNMSKITSYKNQLDTVNELYKTTESGYAYLEKLVNEKSSKFIKNIQDLVSYGLKTIFFDRQDYACDIVVEENTCNIYLCYIDDTGMPIRANIRDSIGGGVKTVIGFIMQVYHIYYYGAEPVVFVDEGFSQLSSKYIPYLMSFIEELANSRDLKLMIISHDDRIIQYGKNVYRIQNHKSIKIK